MELTLQVCHLGRHAMFTTNYVRKYSTYKSAKFKRLEDLSARNKNSMLPSPSSSLSEL